MSVFKKDGSDMAMSVFLKDGSDMALWVEFLELPLQQLLACINWENGCKTSLMKSLLPG